MITSPDLLGELSGRRVSLSSGNEVTAPFENRALAMKRCGVGTALHADGLPVVPDRGLHGLLGAIEISFRHEYVRQRVERPAGGGPSRTSDQIDGLPERRLGLVEGADVLLGLPQVIQQPGPVGVVWQGGLPGESKSGLEQLDRTLGLSPLVESGRGGHPRLDLSDGPLVRGSLELPFHRTALCASGEALYLFTTTAGCLWALDCARIRWNRVLVGLEWAGQLRLLGLGGVGAWVERI